MALPTRCCRSVSPARRAGARRAPAALAATLALLAGAWPAGGAEPAAFDGFAPRAGFAGLGEARAVAVAPDGRVAAGDADGAWIAAPGRAARQVLRRGPVHDLRFEADGTLLAATDRGLFAVDAGGEVRDLGPGPGAAARQVRRVASADGLRLAATAGGVFAGHTQEGGAMRRLDARLPSGDATALALTPATGDAPGGAAPWLLHVVMDGELWRARLADGARGWRVADAARRVLEGVPGTPRDVAAHPAHGLVLLTDRALALGPPEGALESRRLELPPGVAPQRLARAAGRLWLATDGGLLLVELHGDRARARRVAPPAGRVAAHDVAAGPGGLLVATARGLLAAPRTVAAAPGDPGSAASSPDLFVGEPSVQAVHRAALVWLELGPGPVRSLRRRAGRRGWLPRLELRGRYGGGRSLALDEDEAFTGGELRRFHDVDWDRERDFDVTAVLRWDFGDAVFHPEEIDASREAREVIELRDEVLDEINQLYHERRRVLLDAWQRPPGDPEAARLRLRAAELGAGLDAWTGGWWSRQLPPSPARSPEPHTP